MTEDGTALADPIIYMDTRSIDEAEDIRKRLGEDDLFKLSANKIMPGACSLTSILWFRNRRPDVHRKTTVYGHLNTYIGKNLTGNFGIDFSNASYTGLFNTGGNPGWSRETCETLGLDPAILPPLVPSWVSVGGLAERSLIAAGFRPGIPVAMGGGDTACAAFAVGVLDHNQVFESAGTTNVLTACSEKPVFDPRFMNRRHVVPGRWLYHGAMSSTGASVRWLRDEVFQIEEDAEYEKISRLADKSAADAPCPVFLPYMAGERSPIWDPRARGVFFGLSLHTKREHLVRAMFEACAYGNRQLLEIVERMTGEKTEKILSIGGWSAIDIWNQIKADILGRKICALDVSEAAVAGAALLGGMASGVFSNFHDAAARVPKIERKVFTPNSTYKKFYDKRFSVYSALYPKIRDLF
jgi:xylulokinase